MRDFTYTSLPARVLFGTGKISALAEEAERLNLSHLLVLCTPGQSVLGQQQAARLGARSAGIYARAEMHVPEAVASAAVSHVHDIGADGLVAIGGGSAIGLAKAVALETGLPVIAIPTTYAGSEMTPIWGLTSDGVKTTGRDLRVMPKTVIYDPALSTSLPVPVSVTSGMNAIAHCVEALYAEDANPVISMLAETGIRALAQSLLRIVESPDHKEAREQALYGAWLGGTVLGSVGMALHHKICHTLGGSFNLPHAGVHTVMLPYVTAYNSQSATDAMDAIARALGTDNAAAGLYDLVLRLGAVHSLRDLGMLESDLDRAADLATAKPYYNPREINRESIRGLLQAAYEGQRPV